MPTPTYVAIAKTVLTGTQATITFNSIPSTYTDLILLISARVDQAASVQAVKLQFNSDTGNNYSNTYMNAEWNGSSLATYSGMVSASSFIRIYGITGSSSTSNSFASGDIYIPNYAGSQKKPVSITNVSESNDNTNPYLLANAGLWNSTSAINRIDITTQANNFVSGSRFDLYGIKNS